MPLITITGVGSELQGVGRLEDGRAVFVPGALPGEEVEAQLLSVKERYALGRLTRVLSPSPERVAPDCPWYEACGGCRARHMRYACELKLKREKVRNDLTRLGGLKDPLVLDTLPSPSQNAYRDKAEFACRDSRAGVTREGTNELTEVDSCLLQTPGVNRLLSLARPLVKRFPARWLVLRENADKELMLIVSVQQNCDIKSEALSLMQQEPRLKSVQLCLLKPRPAHALDGVCRCVAGAASLSETLLGLKFRLSPLSFFQVNRAQAAKLYELALDFAKAGPNVRIADVYCGAGTISLCAAARGAQVTGIEIVAPAVEDARFNARQNGLGERAEFLQGDAAEIYPRLLRSRGFDAVIVDPPRKGLARPVVDALIAAPAKRLVYISCDPATLARDIKLLTASAYRFEQAVPVDMFPGTQHVETVTLITRA